MKKILSVLLTSMMVLSLSACSSSNSSSNSSDSSAESSSAESAESTADDSASSDAAAADATVIHIGISSGNRPANYVDENGNLAGENYEVMKLIDDMLDEYTFEFDPIASQDVILTGLDSGTYDVAMFNVFDTAERREKYLFPDYPVSAGTLGMILPSEYKDKFPETGTQEEILDICASLGLTMVPCAAGDDSDLTYSEYNETHDPKIDYTVTEEIDVATAISYIREQRYQGAIFLNSNYTSIASQADPNGDTFFVPFSDSSYYTYVIFSKDQSELVSKVNECMKQLFEDGTMAAISEKYYGDNVFSYLSDFEYKDVEPKADYQ